MNKIHFFAFIPRLEPQLPETMVVTKDIIERIQAARKELGLNQSELAKLIGLDRTTVSKLLAGKIDTMRPQIEQVFLDKMGLDLRPLRSPHGDISQAAAKLSDLAKTNADLAATLEFLARLVTPNKAPFLPDIETSKLPKIGAALTRIVMRWENAEDPHYAKIAGEALDWIREYYRKGCP